MSKFKQVITNEQDRVSSKRVVAIMCVFLLCLAFVAESLGWVTTKNDSALIDALVYISMTCLFGTAIEKFNFRKNNNAL